MCRRFCARSISQAVMLKPSIGMFMGKLVWLLHGVPSGTPLGIFHDGSICCGV